VVSTTVIRWDAGALVMAIIVAAQVAVDHPLLGTTPGNHRVRPADVETGSQLWWPSARPVTFGSTGVPHCTVRSDGQVTTGGVVSTTVMILIAEGGIAAGIARRPAAGDGAGFGAGAGTNGFRSG